MLLDTSDLDLVDDILAGGNTESEAETPDKHAEHYVEEQQEVSISDFCLKPPVGLPAKSQKASMQLGQIVPFSPASAGLANLTRQNW